MGVHAHELTKAYGGDWSGSYGLLPGPDHSPKDRSLKVWDTPNGVRVHSFAGDDWRTCRAYLGLDDDRAENPHQERQRNPVARAFGPDDGLRWSKRAETVWRACQSLADTIGAAYLEHRGCAMPEDDVRFHPGLEHWVSRTTWPALVSRVSDFVTCAPITLHMTFLAVDGSDKAPAAAPRLLLPGHAKQGGVVRLTPDEDVTCGLGLAEGIETALAIGAGGWLPVWSALDAGNMGSLPVLAGVESLTIFPDCDPAGLTAAKNLQRRWREAGREVRIISPKEPVDGA